MKHRQLSVSLRCLVLVALLAWTPATGHATTLQVTSAADSGPGSLRAALLVAAPGDTIAFNPGVFPPTGPVQIQPASALPAIAQAGVILDASGAGVVLDGSALGGGVDGLQLVADNCVVRGLTIRRFSGVGILVGAGAVNNTIDGNVIVLNGGSGIEIRGSANRVWGNYIGVDPAGVAAGNGYNGVAVWQGASGNIIGGSAAGQRNVIGGNHHNGIWIDGSTTHSNVVQGNIIGATAAGTTVVPNGMHGVELSGDTHLNQVGGNRLVSEGNLISGNLNHGFIITTGAHHNTVAGNIVGANATGTSFLGNQPYGAADITNGAHDNIIGGLGTGQGNLLSGHEMDGLALYNNAGKPPVVDNHILGNLIGAELDGVTPLPNHGYGIMLGPGSVRTRVEGNTIAHNESYGVLVATCEGNTISANSIYSNTLSGIRLEGGCLAPPMVKASHPLYDAEAVTGATIPNGRVEFFADAGDQGRVYEGFTTADAAGNFSYSRGRQFAGANVTATVTDGYGNTSPFSPPAHLDWTVLLYLNGDNDLQDAVLDTLDNLAGAGASSYANVVALVDGATGARAGTATYDLTRGGALSLGTAFTSTAELNMGAWETLAAFGTWGQAYYPARHTMVAILDHGGGWAPGIPPEVAGALPHHSRGWMSAGASGLSWDFTNDYAYMDTTGMRQALAGMTAGGADKLDVLYYDVCLMGMLEIAYQVRDYADFFLSSQNIGWAPEGADGRYVRALYASHSSPAPEGMAGRLVQAYADANPPNEHPFTVSAIDLSKIHWVAYSAEHLGNDIRGVINGNPAKSATLLQAYNATQKLDYNADFVIDPATEGFVDLYDFAVQAAAYFTEPGIDEAAEDLKAELGAAVIAERHQSGAPWFATDRTWGLDNVHGLSVFLPLGQDLELQPAVNLTLSLRDLYTCDQLRFACDTTWPALFGDYYMAAAVPVPTETMTNTTAGAIAALLEPDVTPPVTTITVVGRLTAGHDLTIGWSSVDDKTGVAQVELWDRLAGGSWTVASQSKAASGQFNYRPARGCGHALAVVATDVAGNVEAFPAAGNTVYVDVAPCLRLPRVVGGR